MAARVWAVRRKTIRVKRKIGGGGEGKHEEGLGSDLGECRE